MNLREYKSISKIDYSGKIVCKKYKIVIEYYTKKQMKKIYPNKNFRVVGEINNKTGIQAGIFSLTNQEALPVYKENTHNRFTERIIGYTAVGAHIYLAVIKNIL